MKTFFKLLLLFGALAYLIFAVIRYSMTEDSSVCRTMSIEVIDSLHSNLVTAQGIERKLKDSHLHPVGRPMDKIDPYVICQSLEKDSFIQNVLCVKTPGEHVRLVVDQRLPLLRVLADNGDNYFIDEKGTIMAPEDYVVDLPIATGHISQAYARKQLREMGAFLRENAFWNNQIVQICILPNRDVDLVMRVGEQVVHLGQMENIDKKFRKLYAFYSTVLPEVGWKKYNEINVAFDNQVVAKKREIKK